MNALLSCLIWGLARASGRSTTATLIQQSSGDAAAGGTTGAAPLMDAMAMFIAQANADGAEYTAGFFHRAARPVPDESHMVPLFCICVMNVQVFKAP